jgi:hypothetical protein
MIGKGANIPQSDELKTLPRWAIVAFAARCARRVEPLFNINWSNAAQEHKEPVFQAIKLAEESAAIGTVKTEIRDIANKAKTASNQSSFAKYPPIISENPASYVCNAASHSADSAADASDAAKISPSTQELYKDAQAAYEKGDVKDPKSRAAVRDKYFEAFSTAFKTSKSHNASATNAFNAAENAVKAAAKSDPTTSSFYVPHYIRADFEKLKQAAAKENWTHTTKVAPDFFGELWHEGKPVWAQKESLVGQH